MWSQKFRKKNKPFVPRDKNDQICTTVLYIHSYILWFSYAFKVCSKSVSEIQCIHPVIVVGPVITHKMFDAGTKHLSATDGQLKIFQVQVSEEIQSSNHLHVHSLQSLRQPTKMSYRYSWHSKNTWCFLYLFVQSMVCRNQFEETLYPHLWVCEQLCCKTLVQNGGYSLFQTRSLILQSDPPGQHEHKPFLSHLHQKMWWKELLLHMDQELIGSLKFGHIGVFVNFASQHNV